MKPLSIDLEWLCCAFEDHGDSTWYLDLRSGDVFQVFEGVRSFDRVFTYEELEDPRRYLLVGSDQASEARRDMDRFVATVIEARLRALLKAALKGGGDLQAFADVLTRVPSERERWFRFRKQRLTARVKKWLAEQGIDPIDRPAGARR